MVFRKAVNKLINLTSGNSAVSTSLAKSVPHQSSSESDNDSQFTNQANKRKQPHTERGRGGPNKQIKSAREQRGIATRRRS